ncbi:TNF receptor-associated factor 2-like [Physella acuta]|uniref:TNF receptor-associated factor 2-like n=1 Tax=Physella acuta TaxID=109671 RepID=UPI0027DE65C1|nr:TNF receptor-associated factor 2-like [Physella acuta]XP_059175338.1 TNF receptor-associated factor 2-like [Physella acuta]XP_059175339.1 TNF receptor-associated factor 2-like [Physella acuta]XP_059175340.1 TNF receptor-associated factor 2-like [Physella acuta]XP_059175341.1 TNF receptor-associated factor 2-like [Physella acuta]XP_059175342.1 TNF receptor-associated factor 2-like [Physella acuta]
MDLQADSTVEIMAQASAPVVFTSQARGYPKAISVSPVEEKFLCGHCELILRNPLQSECGHRFCQSCKDELARSNEVNKQRMLCKACVKEQVPEDEALLEPEKMFEDKAAIREMKKIATRCPNPGCQWKGTFAEYISHETECDKKMVNCQLCGVAVTQSSLQHHETKKCPKRIVSCPYCKVETVHDQLEKHQESCPNKPVKCDKCYKPVLKTELQTHKEDECVHRIVECPVPDCKASLPLDQFLNHFSKSTLGTQKHMLFLFDKMKHLERHIAQIETSTPGAVAGAVDNSAHSGAEAGQHGDSSSGAGVAGAEGGAGSSSMTTEERQKLKLHEDLMAVLHGEILRCIKQVEALARNLEQETKYNRENKDKIQTIERSIATLENKLQSLPMNPTTLADPQEGGILLDAKDGLITWRVDNFAKLRQDAVNDSKPCICSPPFFTGQTGYKMRIRLFPNGDGDAKGKSISAFTQLMKGPFDDLLPWPFVGKVYMMIVDQRNLREHKVVSFNALRDQAAFQKPVNATNIASGLPNLISLSELSDGQDRFIARDCLYMRIYIDLSVDNVQDKLASLNPKTFLSRRP